MGTALADGQSKASDAGDGTLGNGSQEVDPEEGALDVESRSLPPVGRSCQNGSLSFSASCACRN